MSDMPPNVAAPPDERNKEERNEDVDPDEEAEDDFITQAEYDALDAKLDDLNSVLDVIEQKNDRIRDEFVKLLHSNKQIREELQKETKMEEEPDKAAEP